VRPNEQNGRETASAFDAIGLLDAAIEESNGSLDFSALGEGESVFDVDTEVANGAFDLGVTQQSRAIVRIPLCY
jgi:hypothetical protein